MNRLLDLLAVYSESEDLINIGAYVAGTNPKLDEAIAHPPATTGEIKRAGQGKRKKRQPVSFDIPTTKPRQ